LTIEKNTAITNDLSVSVVILVVARKVERSERQNWNNLGAIMIVIVSELNTKRSFVQIEDIDHGHIQPSKRRKGRMISHGKLLTKAVERIGRGARGRTRGGGKGS
jgi:hypothetical protein